MRVLGIESSCDETGVALFDEHAGLLGERLHSQTTLHAPYGGVVPELASRDHVRRLPALTRAVLADAGYDFPALDGIAYTRGPGLAGALLAGAAFARALAWSRQIPALGVHHMEAHLLAPMLEAEPPRLPFVALLVSGGHTMLVLVAALGRYRVLGESLDDAAGEAFDKTAQLLGLAYPGGPAIERLAAEGDPERFYFPRPMTDRPGLAFSFSGLKTYTARTVRDAGDDPATRAAIARAFQDAVVDTLLLKCQRAVAETGVQRLIVAGGVGANAALRARFAQTFGARGVSVHYPRPAFCTDNGAMIAYTGAQRLSAGEAGTVAFDVAPRWGLAALAPPGATLRSGA